MSSGSQNHWYRKNWARRTSRSNTKRNWDSLLIKTSRHYSSLLLFLWWEKHLYGDGSSHTWKLISQTEIRIWVEIKWKGHKKDSKVSYRCSYFYERPKRYSLRLKTWKYTSFWWWLYHSENLRLWLGSFSQRLKLTYFLRYCGLPSSWDC